MRNESPTGQPVGQSTAQHDYSGGLHQKNTTQRAGYNTANVNSATGRDVVTPTPQPQVTDPNKKFWAYANSAQPKQKPQAQVEYPQ